MNSYTLMELRKKYTFENDRTSFIQTFEKYSLEDRFYAMVGFNKHYSTTGYIDTENSVYRIGTLIDNVAKYLEQSYPFSNIEHFDTLFKEWEVEINKLKQERLFKEAYEDIVYMIDFLKSFVNAYKYHSLKGRPLIWKHYHDNKSLAPIIEGEITAKAELNAFIDYFKKEAYKEDLYLNKNKLNTLFSQAYTLVRGLHLIEGISIPYSLVINNPYKNGVEFETLTRPRLPKKLPRTVKLESLPRTLYAFAYYYALVTAGSFDRITKSRALELYNAALSGYKDNEEVTNLLHDMATEFVTGYSDDLIDKVWQYRNEHRSVFRLYIIGYYGVQKIASKYT